MVIDATRTARSMTYGLERSGSSLACRAIPACKGKNFVHDMKPPNDVKRKASARVMIVGEAPGMDENAIGRPFVGYSGKKIDSALATTGLSRNDVYASNVVKCRPTIVDDVGKERNRRPSGAEVKACMPLLEAEIAVLKPSVIVALGVTAVNALTGETSIASAIERGTLYHGSIPVIPARHPAATTYMTANDKIAAREERDRAFSRAARIAIL